MEDEDEKLFRAWFEKEHRGVNIELANEAGWRKVWLAAKEAYASACILNLHREAEKMSREAAKMVFAELEKIAWQTAAARENEAGEAFGLISIDAEGYETVRRRMTGEE